MKPLVATVAVLVALATGAPVQAQTPELDELRALAEQGDATAQILLGLMYDNGRGVPEDATEAVRWYRLAADQRLQQESRDARALGGAPLHALQFREDSLDAEDDAGSGCGQCHGSSEARSDPGRRGNVY